MRRKYNHDKILALVNRGLADWRIAEIMKMQKDRVGIIRRRYNIRRTERRTVTIGIPADIWRKFAGEIGYDAGVYMVHQLLRVYVDGWSCAISPDST